MDRAIEDQPPGNSAWTWIAAGVAAFLISIAGILFELGRHSEQEEEARYRAAQNDIDGLDSYLRTCRHCQFADDAEHRLAQLYAVEIKSAGFDRAKIGKSLTICGLSCPSELRQEAHRRLDILDAERAQYKTASDNAERLEAYKRHCAGCEFKDDADLRLSELHKRPLVVTPTPIVDVKETRTIPVPVTEGPEPDVENQMAVRPDGVEGYEALMQEFSDYPKNPTVRTSVERRREDILWKEAEQAPSSDEKKKLCERLLVLDPQGIYAERAKQCIVASAPPSLHLQDSNSCYFVRNLAFAGKSWLALRTAPSFQAQQSNHMAPSTRLTLLERRGDWMHVRLESGETGWAVSRNLAGCRSRLIP
jgi:hypothetical protein